MLHRGPPCRGDRLLNKAIIGSCDVLAYLPELLHTSKRIRFCLYFDSDLCRMVASGGNISAFSRELKSAAVLLPTGLYATKQRSEWLLVLISCPFASHGQAPAHRKRPYALGSPGSRDTAISLKSEVQGVHYSFERILTCAVSLSSHARPLEYVWNCCS